MDEWEWLDRLAMEVGEPPLERPEIAALLRLARDVAHGVERKLAPLSTFLAGVHVGRASAEGRGRRQALEEVLAAAASLIPPPGEDDGRGPAGAGKA